MLWEAFSVPGMYYAYFLLVLHTMFHNFASRGLDFLCLDHCHDHHVYLITLLPLALRIEGNACIQSERGCPVDGMIIFLVYAQRMVCTGVVAVCS